MRSSGAARPAAEQQEGTARSETEPPVPEGGADHPAAHA